MKAACPVYSTELFWNDLNKYYYIWGATLIVLGLVLALCGQTLFGLTLFVVGEVSTIVLV